MDILGGILIGMGIVLVYDKYLYNNFKELLSAKTAIGKTAVLTIIILFFTILYPADDAVTILAVLWGFGMILIFADVMKCELPQGIIWKLIILIVGIVGVLLIWKGLKTILPPSEITRFLRYALLGAWIAVLPFLIIKR